MDPTTVAILQQIISVLLQAVELGIQYAPQIIADIRATYDLITSGTALTDEQKANAEAAVQSAHAALQAKIAADAAADAAGV